MLVPVSIGGDAESAFDERREHRHFFSDEGWMGINRRLIREKYPISNTQCPMSK
jgi:hypothetical protein